MSLISRSCKNYHIIFNVGTPSLEARNIRLVNIIDSVVVHVPRIFIVVLNIRHLFVTKKKKKKKERQHDDEVRFVLDQHAELDFYSASLLKQKSAGRHVTPL
jgi:hypothetical protein